MKKNTKALKLKLTRDTLRSLENGDLSLVAGLNRTTLTGCDDYANSGCPNSCVC